MGLVTLLAAAEESHRSETPFIFGIALAVFAVLISVVGFTRPGFPGSDGAARGVISVGAVLVLCTMGLIVYVAGG
jgi:hypothetical protein